MRALVFAALFFYKFKQKNAFLLKYRCAKGALCQCPLVWQSASLPLRRALQRPICETYKVIVKRTRCVCLAKAASTISTQWRTGVLPAPSRWV